MSAYVDAKTLQQSAEKEYSALEEKLKTSPLTAKDRNSLPQQEMPCREPHERAKQMEEVALGYTKEQAILEANRGLQC